MEKYIIEEIDCTPSVILNKEEGVFEIKGKSLPEDAVGFYEPIINWVKQYLENPNEETVFIFELVYFNTASSKLFFEIMQELELAYAKGHNVSINWCFDEDDEDIQETGEDFSDMLKVPFFFKEMTC